MQRDELAAWLRLIHTPQVGRESARRLLAAFGSPEGVLSATTASRREVAAPAAATALAATPEGFDALLATTVEWLSAGHDVIALGDARYPQNLLETADPPLLLFASGRIDLLQARSLAIVGSRSPTPAGREAARSFAEQLSAAGMVIVSGLALGIDGAAHEGALHGGGGTIAVVGTGLDRVYPKRHLALAHRIASEGGLLVSEYVLGTPPLPLHFPQRNRIIAGLTQGTLVVEAALRSGSLITARLASEAGRDVFAIPGSIQSPQSQGCHHLIKQGAKLVESVDDVLEEFGPRTASASAASPQAPTPEPDHPLLEAIGYDPVSLDTLVGRTGWSPAELNVQLLELELAGRISRLPGQLFQRMTAA
jgi:DNA processing protein